MERKASLISRIAGRQWFYLLIIIVLLAVAAGIINYRFWRPTNLLNILEQISVLGLVAAGATILIIRPPRMMPMRSLMDRSSGMSEEIMMMNLPFFASSVMNL